MLFPMLRDSDPLLFTTYSISGFKLFFSYMKSFYCTASPACPPKRHLPLQVHAGSSIPRPVLHVLLRDTFLYMYMQEAFTRSLYASVFILCAFD